MSVRTRLHRAVSVHGWSRTVSSLAASPRLSTGSSAKGDNAPATIRGAQQATRSKARQRIARTDQLATPVSPFLTDSFGRQHDYLRISLTEKCNLRCTYCMPEDGVPLMPRDHMLTTDEVERVARMFVAHGVTKIRLTGGEPTIRKDLLDVVARLARLPLASLGITTNGLALKRKLPELVRAGLTHLNLSLDTLDPHKFELMTRRRGFSAVMDALEVAQSLVSQGLKTKLNVVVIRGLNDMEVADFVALTRDTPLTVRFIEYMPFEANRWSTRKLVPSFELVERVKSVYPDFERVKMADAKSDTTRHWNVPGFKGQVGFISSMSDHFCGTCSRLRVGADGRVKVCLFGPPVLSLRDFLRDPSVSDATLMANVGRAVWGKKFAHNGLGGPEGIHESESLRPVWTHSARRSRRTHSIAPTILLHARLESRSGAPPLVRHASRKSTSPPANRLTHTDPVTGSPSMVNISDKPPTQRSATAVGTILLNDTAFSLINFGTEDDSKMASGDTTTTTTTTMRTKKGDVLSVAHLASIMAAKQTSSLIPLCHPLQLTSIDVNLTPLPRERAIRVRVTVGCQGPTGVEMEALTGVSVGLLTIWDMCKAVAGEEMRIGDVMVVKKSGGRSGDWERNVGSGADQKEIRDYSLPIDL